MRRKIYKTLLSFLMVMVMILQVVSTAVVAEGNKKEVDATITNFRLESPKGKKATELNKHDAFYLAMDWKVDNEYEILKEGDYFDIKLPDNLSFPPAYSQGDFDLTDSNGNVIARAHLTRGADNVGGTIRVTFNNKINNKYNVRGTLYLGALFNKNIIKNNQENEFTVSVKRKTASTKVKVTKVATPPDQVLSKWGERVTEGGKPINEVIWKANINYKKANLKDAEITDSLTGDATYIQNSFKLEEVEYNDEGGVIKKIKEISLTGKLNFGADNKSFTIKLGNDGGQKQYRLTYKTTYIAGTELKNNLKLKYEGKNEEVSFTFKDQTAGGTAGGDLASKIKIIKVDAEDNNIVLADAVFEVTGPNGQKFELKTGADGTVVSGTLTQGTYKVKEKEAPKGYVLGKEEYTLNVTPAGGAIQKITNKRIKINISGKKTWDDGNNQDGKRPNKIKVSLLDDNKNVVQTKEVTPDAAGNWNYTFENVDEYNVKTKKKINYTVKEEAVEGYTTEVNGYNVKNSRTPSKTSIKVTKAWEDKNDQDGKRSTSVTIKLLADGVETGDKLTLTAVNGWKGSFDNLDEYKAGKKIQYSIEEEDVGNGYSGFIAQTSNTEFNVINKREPEKTFVEGTKTWNDKDNQDGKRPTEITINLLKNGTKIASKKVTKADGWKWKFENLDKYENGKEINYTITEEKVEGYTTEVKGYDVKNSYTPGKTSLQVTKAWEDKNDQDGVRPNSVTVKLLADGVETGKELVLTKANNWTGSFTDLDEYKAGKKIVYTIKEETVGNGYISVVTKTGENTFTVTNTRTPEKTFVEGVKTWNDKDNQDGKRPTEITINLLKNGTKIASKKVTKADGWKWKFENLDKYENGKEINYTITEEKVEGYTTEVKGYDVKNSYTPGKTSLQVTKAWEDKNDQDGVRPNSVTIKLLADGVETGKKLVLTKANKWTGSFTDLDEYKDGKKIVYTIKEEPVGNGYKSVITGNEKEGFVVTNVRTPEQRIPKTGAGSNSALYTVLLGLSGTVIFSVFRRKRKENL